MNPKGYMQMADPAAYAKLMGSATKGFAAASGTSTGGSWFDPNTWMKMFNPTAYMQAPVAVGKPSTDKQG